MFHVSLPALIMIYLFLFVGGVSVLWLIGEVLKRRQAMTLRRYQIVCQVCWCRYEDRSDKALPECPECGRPNERQGLGDI